MSPKKAGAKRGGRAAVTAGGSDSEPEVESDEPRRGKKAAGKRGGGKRNARDADSESSRAEDEPQRGKAPAAGPSCEKHKNGTASAGGKHKAEETTHSKPKRSDLDWLNQVVSNMQQRRKGGVGPGSGASEAGDSESEEAPRGRGRQTAPPKTVGKGRKHAKRDESEASDKSSDSEEVRGATTRGHDKKKPAATKSAGGTKPGNEKDDAASGAGLEEGSTPKKASTRRSEADWLNSVVSKMHLVQEAWAKEAGRSGSDAPAKRRLAAHDEAGVAATPATPKKDASAGDARKPTTPVTARVVPRAVPRRGGAVTVGPASSSASAPTTAEVQNVPELGKIPTREVVQVETEPAPTLPPPTPVPRRNPMAIARRRPAPPTASPLLTRPGAEVAHGATNTAPVAGDAVANDAGGAGEMQIPTPTDEVAVDKRPLPEHGRDEDGGSTAGTTAAETKTTAARAEGDPSGGPLAVNAGPAPKTASSGNAVGNDKKSKEKSTTIGNAASTQAYEADGSGAESEERPALKKPAAKKGKPAPKKAAVKESDAEAPEEKPTAAGKTVPARAAESEAESEAPSQAAEKKPAAKKGKSAPTKAAVKEEPAHEGSESKPNGKPTPTKAGVKEEDVGNAKAPKEKPKAEATAASKQSHETGESGAGPPSDERPALKKPTAKEGRSAPTKAAVKESDAEAPEEKPTAAGKTAPVRAAESEAESEAPSQAAKKKPAAKKGKSAPTKAAVKEEPAHEGSESKPKGKAAGTAASKRRSTTDESDAESSSDERSAAKRKPAAKRGKPAPKKPMAKGKGKVVGDDDENDKVESKAAAKGQARAKRKRSAGSASEAGSDEPQPAKKKAKPGGRRAEPAAKKAGGDGAKPPAKRGRGREATDGDGEAQEPAPKRRRGDNRRVRREGSPEHEDRFAIAQWDMRDSQATRMFDPSAIADVADESPQQPWASQVSGAALKDDDMEAMARKFLRVRVEKMPRAVPYTQRAQNGAPNADLDAGGDQEDEPADTNTGGVPPGEARAADATLDTTTAGAVDGGAQDGAGGQGANGFAPGPLVRSTVVRPWCLRNMKRPFAAQTVPSRFSVYSQYGTAASRTDDADDVYLPNPEVQARARHRCRLRRALQRQQAASDSGSDSESSNSSSTTSTAGSDGVDAPHWSLQATEGNTVYFRGAQGSTARGHASADVGDGDGDDEGAAVLPCASLGEYAAWLADPVRVAEHLLTFPRAVAARVVPSAGACNGGSSKSGSNANASSGTTTTTDPLSVNGGLLAAIPSIFSGESLSLTVVQRVLLRRILLQVLHAAAAAARFDENTTLLRTNTLKRNPPASAGTLRVLKNEIKTEQQQDGFPTI